MRIGIDVSMIDENKAGIGYYAFSLVNALAQTDKENQYYLLTHNKSLLKDLHLGTNFEILEVSGTGNLKWMLKCLPKMRSLKLNHFLSPSNLFWGCVLNNCTTVVHDIAQIIHPEFFYKKGNLFYRLELNTLLKRSGNVITPSIAVKQQILDNYKSIKANITVIKEGLHSWATETIPQSQMTEVVNKYKLPEKYILTVGTLEPRKNLPALIEGFGEFVKNNSEYKLVIVGKKGWFYEKIYRTVEDLGLENYVIFLGYVPESDLPAIYDLSAFVASLSFYEGFGLPLIEANARNKAVLASNIEVYRELQIEGEYIDIKSTPKELAQKMETLLEKKFTINSDFFDTYSWKTTAQDLIQLWQ